MQTNNKSIRKEKELKFVKLFVNQISIGQSTNLEFETNMQDIRNMKDKQFKNIFNAFFNEI